MNKEMPVFVKITDYKDVVDVIDLIRAKIKQINETLLKINELKNQEDAELELWKNELKDIENKMNFIDQALFDPQNY